MKEMYYRRDPRDLIDFNCVFGGWTMLNHVCVCVLGMEPRALYMLDKCCADLHLHTLVFVTRFQWVPQVGFELTM
jgi:hypothetical protein